MNKKTNYMEIEKLPREVALEIFYRLPPESVVLCKLVCKSWLSLLRDDDHNYFIRRHLQHNLEYPTLTFIAIYEFRDYDQKDDNKLSVVGEFHITKYDEEIKSSYKLVKRINFPQIMYTSSISWNNNIRTRLAGSCNGLLCLTRGCHSVYTCTVWDDRICICNLLLNEYVLLPRSDVLKFRYCLMTASYYTVITGFGHNPITDEYKVVRVYYLHPHCYNNIGDVEVYTLGNKSNGNGMWRSIGTIQYKLHGYCLQQPVLVNGLLHWLSQEEEQFNHETREVVGKHQTKIVSFDFQIEEFHVIPLPYSPVPQEDGFSKMIKGRLKELGGCLCLITEEVNGMDIWMLKDYMNKESWVKEYSIIWKQEPWCPYSLCAIKKKKDGNGDETLLWRYGKRLVTYDPKTLYTREVDQGSDQLYFVTELVMFDHDPVLHINSLVSLKALGEDASYVESNEKKQKHNQGKENYVLLNRRDTI